VRMQSLRLAPPYRTRSASRGKRVCDVCVCVGGGAMGLPGPSQVKRHQEQQSRQHLFLFAVQACQLGGGVGEPWY
jgi:hypothetical protein